MSRRHPIPDAHLDADTFRRLRVAVNERTGLIFDNEARYIFERRLAERLGLLGLDTFQEYVPIFESQSEEQDAVYNLLTTKETYFFRQEYQLRAFTDEVVPMLAESSKRYRRLTVWSAGCSTGEEAYTLAILLSESPWLQDWYIRVLGTDLCQQNVDAALRGLYRETSFRTTPSQVRDRYFEREDKRTYRVSKSLRRMCHFSRVNLMDPMRVRSVGRVDVVFCRNVLIYFDDASRRMVTDALFERLLPGGFLFLGHSESLLNSSTRFQPVHLASDLAYRRPAMTTFVGGTP